MRKLTTTILFVALLAASACSTDPAEEASSDESSTTSAPTDGSSTSEAEVSDDPRAPGVTDDTIKVGVTYPDLKNLQATIGINHGDYEAAYQAVADALNEQGAFGDRKIELVFAPVDPQASDAGTAACTRLAQDEQVFVVVGQFQGDEVLCYVDTNEVPVIGGNMSPDRLEKAEVAWFTVDGTADLHADATRQLIEADVFGDSVAVVGTTDDVPLYDDVVGPTLEEAGVDVIGPAYIDTTSGDANTIFANTDTILDRFEAEGAEQVLVIGNSSGFVVSPRLSAHRFSPQLIFTEVSSVSGFVQGDGSDLSSLEGAVAMGLFDDNDRFDELDHAPTSDCVEILDAAGHTMVPTDEVPDGELRNAVSGFDACKKLYLLAAIVEAAGEDLNYGTFQRAGNGLGEVDLPGIPEPATFGPPPSADGDIPLLFFEFDAAAASFVTDDV